jgi:DNA-binding transcriptional MerR regulator
MSEKLWFKIGEAAGEIGVSPHEIRYWEKKIPEIRPRRSKGNLRYYHRDDLPKLQAIRRWTEAGFSAADCRVLLLKGHVEHDLGMGAAHEGLGGLDDPWDGRTRPARIPAAGRRKEAPAPAGEGAPGAAKAGPLPLPQLESIVDALKDVLARLERPLP